MDGKLFLLTSGSLRKRMLERVLDEACDHLYSINSLTIDELKKCKLKNGINFIFLDLPNMRGSAIDIISEVKLIQPDAFVIGIHFYLNKKLIQPLMEEGLNGYLLYNPIKQDARNAMNAIKGGQKYLPPELQ